MKNADHMGLSTLYQLRGRVGRSNRIAYAYLMYRPEKSISEVSEKRLEAIKDLQNWVPDLRLLCEIFRFVEQESPRKISVWFH